MNNSACGRDLGVLALEWSKQGVPVFPCDSRKRPLTENGFYDASTDEKTVLALFEGAGDRAVMIGARMGKDSGLFAVDADTYKGGTSGISARQYVETLTKDGLLPRTREHRTLSHGTHYLYFSEEDWPSCKPADGVEVKGEGGYIIVPPTPGYEVIHKGIAVAPSGLIARLKAAKAKTSDATIAGLKQRILSAEDFHDSLAMLSAKLSGQGWPPERVQNELLNTLQASVARVEGHPRHKRWLDIMQDKGGELTRFTASADAKYNFNNASDQMRAAVEALGLDFSEGVGVPQSEEPEQARAFEDYEHGLWPFNEGQGYFAWSLNEQEVLRQDFVLHPLLSRKEVTLISADPKAGKTLVSQTLAMCVAAGVDFDGEITVDKQRPVIYCALESKVAIRKRAYVWMKKQNEKRAQEGLPPLSEENFPFYVLEIPLDLTNETVREDFATKIAVANTYFEERSFAPCGCIVFDTLTKAMPGKDQNSVEDTSAVFSVVDNLRAMSVDAAVLYVHHDNKNGSTRGSSNISAEPDTLLGLSKKDNGDLRLWVKLARSIEDDQDFIFGIESEDIGYAVNEAGEQTKYLVKAPYLISKTHEKAVREHAPEQEDVTKQAIALVKHKGLVSILDFLEPGTYDGAQLEAAAIVKGNAVKPTMFKKPKLLLEMIEQTITMHGLKLNGGKTVTYASDKKSDGRSLVTLQDITIKIEVAP